MPEFDLDSFKKTWQEQPVQNKYDNDEILQMLNRKSRNYVKYIFWISVIEFVLFTAFGLFYILQNKESNTFLTSLQKLGVQQNEQLQDIFDNIYLAIKAFTLLITGYFVVKFYQNYRKIKVEEDLKEFISRIIKFKKTVNAFILINILIVVVFTSALTIFGIYAIQNQNTTLADSSIIAFIVSFIISTVLCVVLIWAYYRLVYGILIKRLDKNLTQLKEIDSQEK
ncbi:beta-carotene 15,15'-monooxygenase [Chryseobacterium aquaticum]|uniref:Beta-carotene 15,15'-monooxygenase n=1 Tax=Chryseobacterium aquaticum TaxID=452084 RepID=A0A848N6X1_9FLAO|nr:MULTISPECIES: beta-carotene 15,15'-monooxygenase [Chryseobacterium]NMR36126.1 beta-carotene 15,15'-monooxygenase [Chryseobacterium aquaticum]NRQ48201.1 beta-carotene 15,15'-monooxygenase [Chryseobacterium sp. C-204]